MHAAPLAEADGKRTVSAVAGSGYCISAWKPACFSKVAILHTYPKAENTRWSTSMVITTDGCTHGTHGLSELHLMR